MTGTSWGSENRQLMAHALRQLPRVAKYGVGAFLIAALSLGCFPGDAAASFMKFLPLSSDGQASYSIDTDNHLAYVVDLGRDARHGEAGEGASKLLQEFDGNGVRKIAFICSHPHLDHGGGIEKIFQDPRLLFKDAGMTQPRYEAIIIVDDGAPDSLRHKVDAALGKAKISKAAMGITYRSAKTGNALSGFSSAANSVHVQTIEHRKGTAGPHGRSVVTLTTLQGPAVNGVVPPPYRVLDFDDAETAVVNEVVENLQKMGVTSIDAFVVPHHGSAYHDVESVFKLSPKKAIISVNPRNRYGHPAPTILKELMQRLKPENVLLTGSRDEIRIAGDGTVSSKLNASMKEAYLLFIEPQRQRHERLARTSTKESTRKSSAKRLKDIEALYPLFGIFPPDATSPGAPRGVPPGTPPSGGGGAGLAADAIHQHGTMLSGEMDMPLLTRKGATPDDIKSQRVFQRDGGMAAPLRYQTGDGDEVVDRRFDPTNAERELMAGASPVEGGRIEYVSNLLLPNELEPPGLRKVASVAGLKPPRVLQGRRPRGGMVYLTGGKLHMASDTPDFVGARLELCGKQLCVVVPETPERPEERFTTPLQIGPLFREVWKKVMIENVDAFYLSINPLAKTLRYDASVGENAPESKLKFGGNPLPQEAANAVVTAGGIERGEIGRILWEADVAFKSESLGLDVLTGRQVAVDPPVIAELAEYESQVLFGENERWCRLYWETGRQELNVDHAKKTLRYSGNAVVAAAEAMVLQRGQLESYPQGQWCGVPKQVARRLQQRANATAVAPSVLRDLRTLAEIQNLLVWARDQGIVAGEELAKALALEAHTEPFRVPTWTSGIRTKSKAIVQLDRRKIGAVPNLVMHVASTDRTVWKDCAGKFWAERDEAFGKQGLVRRGKAWQVDPDDPFIQTWMEGLSAKTAQCAKGTLLPSVFKTNEGLSESGEGKFGISHHDLPVSYHGGVLLGREAARDTLRKHAQGSAMFTPSRKLIMRQAEGILDFWSVEAATSPREHVRFVDASILDVFATHGVIRFVVQTDGNTVVRRELQIGKSDSVPAGMEWVEAVYSLDGRSIMQVAAWPCEPATQPDSICVDGNMSRTRLTERLTADEASPMPMKLERIDERLWLVELTLQGEADGLMAKWDGLSSGELVPKVALIALGQRWGLDPSGMVESLVESDGFESTDWELLSAIVLRDDFDPLWESRVTTRHQALVEQHERGNMPYSRLLKEAALLRTDAQQLSPASRLRVLLDLGDRIMLPPSPLSVAQRKTAEALADAFDRDINVARALDGSLLPWRDFFGASP